MIRFEVTGATPEEFAENAMKAFAVLAIGLQAELQAKLASTKQTPETSGSENSSTASKADPTDADVDAVMEMDRRGGLIQKKIEERKQVHSDPVDDLWKATSLENQPTASSASSDQKAVTPSKSKTKGPKLDDLKTRLSEVIVAATERWDQKRANAYARKLLKQFGVEKLGDLKPEDYSTFLHDARYYVDGFAVE